MLEETILVLQQKCDWLRGANERRVRVLGLTQKINLHTKDLKTLPLTHFSLLVYMCQEHALGRRAEHGSIILAVQNAFMP